MINALKLLANQQEDGDGFIQNVVTKLGVTSRTGLTQGLREFIKIDNQRALEVGYLSQGIVRRRRGDGQVEPRRIDASRAEEVEVRSRHTSMSTT